jgi:metallophosphoesterase superfamily enzyme
MMDEDRTPPGKPLPVDYAGETVWLLPERALWWPAGRVLFVADLHLGKAATYRAWASPCPRAPRVKTSRA